MKSNHPTLSEGRYVVQRCIGRGGMGAVFLAYDEVMKGPRAIKVLDPSLTIHPEARARFRTEAVAMSQLNHPHIIRVFDQGQEGLTSYIVMEYVAGGTLRSLLRREGCLDRDLAISMCLDIADGLNHAHARGIIHRDIKPDNILLDEVGAKITDFGIARVFDAGPGLTRSRAVLGTPAFMSPEQRLDGKRCTARTDVYSLAATLFVLLSDRDPIDLYEPDACARLLEGIDPALAAVIRTAVQMDPEERYPSVRAMAAALEAARDVPGAERSRPSAGLGAMTQEELDLDALHRLWRSYVTPPGQSPDQTMAMTFSMDADAPGLSEDGGPSDSQADVETVSEVSAPVRSRWLLPIAVLLVLGLGVVGSYSAPMLSSWTEATVTGPVVSPLYADAEAALLAADPDGAGRRLDAQPPTAEDRASHDLLRSLLHMLDGAPGAAAGAMSQAAAASTGVDGSLARAIELTDAVMSGRASSASRAAEWEALLAEDSRPLLHLTHVLSASIDLDPEQLAVALDQARERHPDDAIFALLPVLLGEWSPVDPARLTLLDAALAAHPTSPGLVAERCRVLLWEGRTEAAEEGLRRLEELAPASAEWLRLQSGLRVMQADKVAGNEAFMTAFGDSVSERLQGRFADAFGSAFASVGQLQEARKIWNLGVVESQRAGLDRLVVSLRLRDLQASNLHGVPPGPEASFDVIRSMIESSQRSTAWKTHQVGRLLFLDGVRAARAGDHALAELRRQQLGLHAPIAGEEGAHRVSIELLTLEAALASGEEGAAVLLARARSGSAEASTTCGWIGLRMRLAARAEANAELAETTARLRQGVCRGSALERELLAVEGAVALAERAPTKEARASAQESVAALQARWVEADEALSLTARMHALGLSEP